MATKNARDPGTNSSNYDSQTSANQPAPPTTSPTEFTVRPATATVSTEAQFTSRALDEAATRLRSWAATRGYLVRGRPFVILDGSETCRVSVPVDDAADPHPETGITAEQRPAGAVAGTASMTRRQAENVLPGLLDLIANLATGPPEFHAGKEGFGEGTLQIPVLSDPFAAVPTSKQSAA